MPFYLLVVFSISFFAFKINGNENAAPIKGIIIFINDDRDLFMERKLSGINIENKIPTIMGVSAKILLLKSPFGACLNIIMEANIIMKIKIIIEIKPIMDNKKTSFVTNDSIV